MSQYFIKPKSLGGRVKVQLEFSHYATKVDFKKCNSCWYIEIC